MILFVEEITIHRRKHYGAHLEILPNLILK